jgi:hypothetical protein
MPEVRDHFHLLTGIEICNLRSVEGNLELKLMAWGHVVLLEKPA